MRRVLVVAAAVLASCTDIPLDPQDTVRLQTAQVSGNSAYFSFLSPIDEASPLVGTGVNARLATVVEVCHVVAGECGALVASFAPTETGDPALGIVAGPDHYHVNWRLSSSALQSGQRYRIVVLTGASARPDARVLGTIDVLVDAGAARVLDPATGQVVSSYNLTQTIPVKYRAERGLLCETLESDTQAEPCLETWVDFRGGTFVVSTELAGVHFPPGALPEDVGPVNLIIERYESPDGTVACIPTTYPQFIGCYVFRLEPDVRPFLVEVVVGICPDEQAIPFEVQLELWKWDGNDPSTTQSLPRRIVEFLECPGWTSAGAGLAWAPRWLRPLVALVTPDPLHAVGISPFGGGLHDFTRIGWVRPLLLTIVAGNNETAVAGNAVAPAPQVRVVANGEKVQGLGVGVAGVPISFAPGGPDDSVNPNAAVTDAQGYATTEWTLGALTGGYTMTATGYNPLSAWPNISGAWGSVVFNATAVDAATTNYAVNFLSPMQKGAGSGGTIGGLAVSVEICRVTGPTCTPHATIAGSGLRLKERFYQGSWNSTGAPNGRYRLRVLVNNAQVGVIEMEATRNPATTGTEPYQFKAGQNVEIKFGLIAL